nr:glycosyltransferase family 4 protein [Sporomusa acidovorans]
MKNKKKIAIIGPYPPPYGGISVHIQRVLAQLESSEIRYYDFYNETKNSGYHGNFYLFYSKITKMYSLLRLFLSPYKLIHHHSPDLRIRIILGILGLMGKNVYLHIHGASLKNALNAGGIKGILMQKVIKHVHILADNYEIMQIAKKNHAKSVTMIDAFIPPLYSEAIFTEFCDNHVLNTDNYDAIISMVGWFTYYNQEDLYGFDLLVEVVKELAVKYKILVLVSINGVIAQNLHDDFVEKIEKNNLVENFYLIYEDLTEVWPIYLLSDVFLRLTNTDGNALSINESLWFETPVIASDCIDRPKGTILFKNRDVKSLEKKIEQVILERANLLTCKQKIEKMKTKRFTNRLFKEIYHVEE